MTRPYLSNEEEVSITEEESGKDVKEGVTPEGNLLPPEGWEEAGTQATESEESVRELFEAYEDRVMQWAEDPWFYPVVIFVVVWSLVWKGVALWKAACNNQKGWFIAVLLVNTVGILEMLYLKWGQRRQQAE